MEMNFLTLYLLPLIVGWVLDLVFGDPEKLPHPVVLFGKLIAKGERLLNRGSWRRMKGALLAIGLVAATVAATWALLQLADAIYIIIGVAARAILVFYCLAGTTLIKEVRDVFLALDRSLDEGRRQVARIVGRDTSELSREEVQKAADNTEKEINPETKEVSWNLKDGFTNLKFTVICIFAAFIAAAGYGLISMVRQKELFCRMRDGFLYLSGIFGGRFVRYQGQGKAVLCPESGGRVPPAGGRQDPEG